MRHSFLYRGQHVAVEMSARDEGLSWRFAVNGGEFRRGDQPLDFALPGGIALASACEAARSAVDRIQRSDHGALHTGTRDSSGH